MQAEIRGTFGDQVQVTRGDQIITVSPSDLQRGDMVEIGRQRRIITGYNPERGWETKAAQLGEDYYLANPLVNRFAMGLMRLAQVLEQ